MKARYILLFLSVFTMSLVASLSFDLGAGQKQIFASDQKPFELSKDAKAHLGIYFSQDTHNALIVKGFKESSFGLKENDKIISWNGSLYPTYDKIVHVSPANSIIIVIVERAGKLYKYKIPTTV